MNWLSSFLKPNPSVSVIVLEGEIGQKKSLSLTKIKKKIEKAFKKPNLLAVALQINSNGGSPVQSSSSPTTSLPGTITTYLLNQLKSSSHLKMKVCPSFKMVVLFRSKTTGVPMFAFAEDCAGEDSLVKNCTSFHI